jgi:type II secretory pathway component PulC
MRWDWLEPYLQQERLPKIAIWVLSACLAYSILRFIWIFLPPPSSQPTLESNTNVKSLPILANWHLFGIYTPTSAALEATQLPIKLIGIFYATPPATSRILISISGQSAKLFTPGQTLLPGVIIEEILRDSVTLKHNDKLESLPLPVPVLQFASPPRVMNFSPGS